MTLKIAGGCAAALALALCPAACLQTVVLDRSGSGGGTGGPDGGGLEGGGSGLGGGGPGADGSVGGDAPNDHIRCPNGNQAPGISAQREVPTMIIAFDRSSSMSTRFGNNGTRFSVTRDAITKVLGTYNDAVRFGYVEFPGIPVSGSCENVNGCCAGPVSPLTSAGGGLRAITDPLGMCDGSPGQVGCLNTDATPTAQAMSRINNRYSDPNLSADSTGPRYALLITDGEPTCPQASGSPQDSPCMQAESEITKLSFASVTVSTFVVAIGDIPGVPSNVCLDRLALAGGVSRDVGPPYYYPAKTDDVVQPTLNGIFSGIACHINVIEPSFDPDRVEVDINGDPIPHDPTRQNGWTFDEKASGKPDNTRITLYGAACDRFVASAGSSHQVTVRACPAPH